ncbi:MAG TPA: hypothetical protein VM639_24500 [Dongiaceae bacterium]|nr:hypothetical protein [Dongiaceae bacterium]
MSQIEELERELANSGKLIEAGWHSLRVMTIPTDAPAIQLAEMRTAFFAGAQHVFATLLRTLDDGDDATDGDLNRLALIQAELDGFIKEFEARYMPTKGNG